MKKLLIVEDEKLIRQGLHAMVKRSLVPIDEIILCKNGEEAYEIIKNQKIDVLITDIRMPQKDGITLVKEIQSLHYVPKVIVISGYDDFSYAVELLRYGAREYILKPVERDTITKILVKLENEIRNENELKDKIDTIQWQQLKYMLMNPSITEAEVEAIEAQFRGNNTFEKYVVCCTNYKDFNEADHMDVVILDDVNGQSIFIVNLGCMEEIIRNLLKDYNVGVSREHNSIKELREAYQEALHARKCAFATGNSTVNYTDLEDKKEIISDEMINQFVQMVGTDKLAEADKFLGHVFYKTKKGIIEPDDFYNAMITIVEKICSNYKNLVECDREQIISLKNIFEYNNANSYYEELSNWIEQINEKIIKEYDDYKNKQKIQMAITYIYENYHTNLNMAVVSNYISMNYSLFSYVFKNYTGTNFVHYLKTLRINEAKKLLEETDKKIIEISYLVGYENEKHFMKIFRSVCGVSPSEYRKNAQIGKMNMNS